MIIEVVPFCGALPPPLGVGRSTFRPVALSTIKIAR